MFLVDLMQARDALCRFLMRNYDSLFGFQLAACFHCLLLPHVADFCMIMGSTVGRFLEVLEVPSGSMILPTIHVVHFRRNHGPTMNAILHFFLSCGRNHLKNLRRHSMDHEKMEELAQSTLFPLRMRGDSSMSHSIYMRKTYGKSIVDLHRNFSICMYLLTIYVQGFAQRRIVLPSRFYGLHKAIMDDHSLRGNGEEIYYGEHVHHAYYILHFLQEVGAARKWWGGHPSFHFLW